MTTLKEEDVPKDCTSFTISKGVKTIGDYAFSHCTNLTSITIPESVKTIGYHTFFRCTNLTSITIPEGVKIIGNDAFSYCTNLKKVKVIMKDSDDLIFQNIRKEELNDIWKSKFSYSPDVEIEVCNPCYVKDMLEYICIGKEVYKIEIKDWEMINLYNILPYIYGVVN